ncbi:MAG: hypothetical protein OXN17_11545 [Candidatus Poribacteria bacterium]|nr:hypothetical protein [Candidatus Poribacteria bacterium]MDE0505564.1 hypothetical protein [Candidatus Poribacteria bacterium]
MTSEQARSLKESLESMFEHIASREGMGDDLRQIEELQREIASTAPTMLNHYLQRRSYTKALDFLNQEFDAKNFGRPTSADD